MLKLIGYQNIRTMPRSLIQKIIVEIFKCSIHVSSLFFCLLSIFIFFPFFVFSVLVFDLVFFFICFDISSYGNLKQLCELIR